MFDALQRRAVGLIISLFHEPARISDGLDAQGQVYRGTSQGVSVCQQCSHGRSVASCDRQHVGKARVQRQAGDFLTMLGDPPVVVECTKHFQ